jgi:endonuclease G
MARRRKQRPSRAQNSTWTLLLLLVLLFAAVYFLSREEETPAQPPPPTQQPGQQPPPPRDVLGAERHLALGNPSGATAEAGQPANYLIQREQYALAYNRDRGIPNWVSWHLEAADLGPVERYPGPFIPDTALPQGWYLVQHRDYSGSGYDRGHMVPSADRTSSPEDNQATFILTNVLPQAPANNQGPWSDLENHIRNLVEGGNEVYQIAGPQGEIDTLAGGRLTVPAAVWKVAVVLPAGQDDLGRVTAQTEVIAVLMPNDTSVEGRPWRDFLSSIGCIEERTGLDLLGALPDDVEAALAGGGCAAGSGAAPVAGGGAAGAAGVQIVDVAYNPPGDDLAGEYVLLRNGAAGAVGLAGWTIEDEGGARYTFPTLSLGPGAEVRLWTGPGADSSGDLYWGRTQPVWNNSGDTAVLRDGRGREVARFRYP